MARRKHRHNLSHQRRLTGKIGQLLPCGLVEVLPGDRFRHNASAMVRLAPMAAPVMQNMTVRIHHLFVPHRLSWRFATAGNGVQFEDFITGGADGKDATTVPVVPTPASGGTLLDYLGIPAVVGSVNALPLAGLNLIFNEWYRDQDLVTARAWDDTSIPNVAYEKDRETAARPWPQKGDAVTLPLGDKAPIQGLGITAATFAGTNSPTVKETGGGSRSYAKFGYADESGGGQNMRLAMEEDPDRANFPGFYADLSQATAITVTALRLASALQRFAEARSRWGSRYAEYVRHVFGAAPLDSRLQRPEYLGGGSNPVSISEVLQTAPDDAGDPRYGVADLYGHGVGMARSNRYTQAFQEHGYVYSLMSVRPRAMYLDGVETHWLYETREDFYQPELALVGQQSIKAQEVFFGADKNTVFGWQDRYSHLKQVRNQVAGEFRTILDYWHLGRKFSAEPALNQAFIEVNPADQLRIFNEQTTDHLWCQVSHQLQAIRGVVRDSTPRLL